MRLRSNGIFAIVIGAFMLCAETCLHFGDLVALRSWVDLPIQDWIAGAFLMYGGFRTRRDASTGLAYEAAGWAFMASLLTGAFVGHWEEWSTGATGEQEWIPAGALLAIIAALLIASISGLVVALVAVRRINATRYLRECGRADPIWVRQELSFSLRRRGSL